MALTHVHTSVLTGHALEELTRARTRVSRPLSELDTIVWPRRTSTVGRRIGDYELGSRIGSGGMAEVYSARRLFLAGEASKQCAIKLLTGERARNPRFREMFLREARISLSLSHQNLVNSFAADEENGEAYLVMEWVDGPNLAELNERMRTNGKAMPLTIAAYIVGEVLHGLAYAQTVTRAGDRMGVIHRDVSPQNVLVSSAGEIKIADFGIARIASDDTTGTVKGKLRYMAPEQFAGDSNDPRVDLYAVGALLHELLDGRRFRHDAKSEAHLTALTVEGSIPALRNPDVPRELEALRVGLLQPKRQARIGSAREALELLARWPGYQNAKIATANLVLGHVKRPAPRSGIHDAATSPARAAERSSEFETRTVDTPASQRTVRVVATPQTSGRRWAPVVFATLAGAFVAVGGLVVFELSTRSETIESAAAKGTAVAAVGARVLDAPREEGGATSPDIAAASSHAEPPDAPPKSEGATEEGAAEEGAAEEGAGAAEEPAAQGPAADEPTAKTAPVASKAAKKPKKAMASVSLRAGQFAWATVRIDGRQHVLEPNKDVRLSVGSHRVYVKAPNGERFQSAGRIEIGNAAAGYVVRLRETPLGLSISER